jgi:formamidopyrimidine-DNA glycosylase
LGNSLTLEETGRLREALQAILQKAVEVDADYEKFPETWLFHHRWGGNKGAEHIDGREILREMIGGRTTAWVPEIQH